MVQYMWPSTYGEMYICTLFYSRYNTQSMAPFKITTCSHVQRMKYYIQLSKAHVLLWSWELAQLD